MAFSEDAGVVIDAVVAAHDDNYHLSRLDFPGGNVAVARRKESIGQSLRLRIHARDVSLTLERATGTSIANLLPATVVEIADADTPAHCLVRLDAGGTPLIARITRRSLDQLGVARGKAMWAQIKAVALLGD
jgi:molybdate transport system ATP-binding protein